MTSGSAITTLGAATLLTGALPSTNQDGGVNGQGAPYLTSYETPYAPSPNVTSSFVASGLPIQSSDWWSSVMFRTIGLGTQASNGYDLNSSYRLSGVSDSFVNVNNLSYPMFADPLILQVDSSSSVNGGITTFDPRGLGIGYAGGFVNTGVNAPGQNTDAIITSNVNQDLLVRLKESGQAISSANIKVDNYSDWGATFAWNNQAIGSQVAPTAAITATAANGSPYVSFTTAGGSQVEIILTGQGGGPSLAYLSTNGRVAVVVVPNGPNGFVTANNVYALFAPEGGQWVYSAANGSDPSKLTMALTGANATASYFSIAVLPSSIVQQSIDGTNALLETFRQHAYAFVLGPAATRAAGFQSTPGTELLSYSYNAATSSVTSTMGVTTQLMDASDATLINRPLFSLYAHQFKNLVAGDLTALTDPSGLQYQYNSGKGPMRLFAPQSTTQGSATQTTSFSTQMYYKGILPYLPNALGTTDPTTQATLIGYVHDVATGLADTKGLPFPGISQNVNFISTDTNYPAGKHLLRLSLVLPIVDQLLASVTDPTLVTQLTSDRATLLAQLQTAFSSFFDVGAYQFLAYNSDWDTLIPYPDDNGTATNLNDKHFKWGYFLRSAAMLARYNPDFVSPTQYGKALELLVRDAANWERTTSGDFVFPFLRNFNPYAGHSWANGDSVGGNGNNQESSAEAINFAVGLIQFGDAYAAFDATKGAAIRNLGIYLFTTETEAISQYYFNVDQDNFPDQFTLNYATAQPLNAVGASDTQITLGGSSTPLGFPQNAQDQFRIRMDNETMLVTSVAGNVFNVIRGYDDSTAVAHSAAAGVSLIDPFTTLTGLINATDTLVTVASNAGFPPAPANGAAASRFLIRIDQEILAVVGGAGTTSWTIVRGLFGTTAAPHASGASAILYGQVAPWGNLSSPLTNAATSISVISSGTLTAFPSPATTPFVIHIGGERMLVTGQTNATTWTVLRGYDGTLAIAHNSGDRFEMVSRNYSWTPPITSATAAIGATDTTISVDTSSFSFGGFGNVPTTVTTTALAGSLLSFSTTLSQAITDSTNQVINIELQNGSSSITAGNFYITVGTTGNQSTYYVNTVGSAPYTTWNVKRLGSGSYTTYAAGTPVTLFWPSSADVGSSDAVALILDVSSVPPLPTALAPFQVIVGADTYTVTAVLGTQGNVWQTGQALQNTYTTPASVVTSISATDTAIALESTAGFPSAGFFQIQVDREIMLVTGRYVESGTTYPDVWSVVRGYAGTTAVAHSNPTGVVIHSIDPSTSFTIQVGTERMRVIGQSSTGVWNVIRGVDGTTAASHVINTDITLAERSPVTKVDITGRLYGSGPQKTTFFSTPALDREAAFRVIQSLPISGASIYLGQFRNADGTSTARTEARALADFEQFLINAQVYPGQVNAGGIYPATIWGYQALSSPSSALSHFNQYITNNYAYNVLVGSLAAQPITSGANSFLIAPSNLVFVVPPSNNPILVYSKVALGAPGANDTMLVTSLQLNADSYGNTLLSGTRSNGQSQSFGAPIVPAAFTTSEQGNVTTQGALTWGTSTVTIQDSGNNPFPFTAPLEQQENVAFWVQVTYTVNSLPVTETWQVNQQTRHANGTRTWVVTRELIPLPQSVDVAAPTIPASTAITPIPAYFKINANSGLDEGESAPTTYHLINQLHLLGTPDPGVVAPGATQFGVFVNANGQRSYAIYNDGTSALTNIGFYAIQNDGTLSNTPLYTFASVAAGSFAWYSEQTSALTNETVPSLTLPTTSNQLFLLNGGAGPNGLAMGGQANPGGSQTSLLTLPTNGTNNPNFTGGLTFTIDNVTGTYDSTAGGTQFQFFTVSGSTENYSNQGSLQSLSASLPNGAAYSVIARVSYYSGSSTAPGAQPFYVELFNQSTYNNPNTSSATSTYDQYSSSVGVSTTTGAPTSLSGGSVKVELWLWTTNSQGAQNVGLKVGTPFNLDPQASWIKIPFTGVSVSQLRIDGAVSNQQTKDNQVSSPFESITISNAGNPLGIVLIQVSLVQPGDGIITSRSLDASGFVADRTGAPSYRFQGTASDATMAIRKLQFLSVPVAGTKVVSFKITANDGVAVVENTLTSQLVTPSGSSNADFVQSLYANILERNGEPKGMAYWIGQLDRGRSREWVERHFLNSRELRELRIDRYYIQFLGRPADPAGRDAYVRQLGKGASLDSIVISMLTSREFRASRPSNEDFIRGLYQVLLKRAPDTLGLKGWLDSMNHGMSPRDVVKSFLSSSERQGVRG